MMKHSSVSADEPNPLRRLPPVHRLLATPIVEGLPDSIPLGVRADAARTVLERARVQARSGDGAVPDADQLAAQVAEEAVRRMSPTLRGAINATGVVLHTGLGRACLADAAREAVLAVASGHALVEIDRDTGRRGSRRDHVRGLLCELTGAEDATVVNNCAGAVFLAVTALAVGREVIISRGELVEIGGAFRMPDIIRASGATLVEVGTTNRTRIADYRAALTERTALILRCHPSNFAIVGFTEEATTAELAQLGRECNLPVMDDQGNGALLDLTGQNNTLITSVAAGCDVTTASADKLMGGPQAGLILGQQKYIDRIARHPLARALRVDKLTLAALEATLRLYRDPVTALSAIPTLRYLTRQEPELRRMAMKLRARLRRVLPEDQFDTTILPERSRVGGGSLPGEDLPTWCVALQAKGHDPGADEIAAILRANNPAIFARIKGDAVLFDPRTLEDNETAAIASAVKHIVRS